MRYLILAVLAAFSVQLIHAQVSAITESGDQVILYKDGTWKYLNDSLIEASEIPFNNTEFKKDDDATFMVKSKKMNVGLYINPKKWTFSKGSSNDAAEYLFQKKDDDFYAMIITEKVPIPVETLRGIAIDNARNVAPDVIVEKEEYRMVNGLKVLLMQMTGTMNGLKFTYYSYYFSNDEGTLQLVSYSGEKMLKDHIPVVENFINGLVAY